MKKILTLSLITTLALTACDKPPAQTDNATPQTNTTPTPPEQHAKDQQAHNHDHTDDHDHSHDHHDHDHDHHDHAHHAQGDTYQCGDKTIQIAVHTHEGEVEAQLTQDDITYELNEAATGKFISDDDSIDGTDTGMALILNGDQATVSTLNDKVLLTCTKKGT